MWSAARMFRTGTSPTAAGRRACFPLELRSSHHRVDRRRCLSTSPSSSLHNEEQENCADTAAYYDTAEHYDKLWGKDNIHIGYYPHLKDRHAPELGFQAAARVITTRIIELGGIDHTSRVLDLGCGKGAACAQIAELTGAAATGLDLSSKNIERAKALAASRPKLELEFVEGSFTNLPSSLHGSFTHVISQEAFSHIHAELPTIFEQIKLALAPGGTLVVNDYLGADGEVSEATRRAVHDRLGFSVLLGHKDWRRAAEQSGLELMHYENLNAHMAHGYSQLAELAATHSVVSASGTPLAQN